MWWFLILKSIHVLSAIVAVGANATYGVWSAIAGREASHLGFALRGIKAVDGRLANPAYGVLLITGIVMAVTTYSITTTWILIGLGIYAVMAVGGVAVYAPVLKRQIAALDAQGPTSADYRSIDARARGVGMFL